ncbi:monocarboxylate transporter 8-like isoform X2 [Actinia tenebrosa]|uniref:Monocarboxylate transporter 8-like isoform X2 n=1 Tax=Actinia tenebrosa TaxID=6105 RepID=A0A6P8IKT1_ACTTE|nr:monocarboxylate transporter 8-like isoform X2 [Actinia tenebrosa]
MDTRTTAGSVAIAITFLATLPAGKLVDYFGLRVVSLAGSLICALSLLLTSFAKSIVVIYFTYSLGFGVGSSFLYTASMFVTTKYFKKRRATAVGIVCAGGGCGYLAMGPLIQLSLNELGIATSFRIMAGVLFLPGIFSLLYSSDTKTAMKTEERREDLDTRPLKKVHVKKKMVDCLIWKNPSYTVNIASLTLASLAHYIPQLYLVENCETLGISAMKASQLLIFIGLATIFTRTTIGFLLNYPRVSSSLVFQCSQLLDAFVHLTIPFANKYEHFVIVSVLYGCADGAFCTTLNHILLTYVRKPEQVSAAFGYGCIVNSMTIAAGAPLAGILIQYYNSYSPAFFAGAGVLFISSMIPSVYLFIEGIISQCCKHPRRNLESTIAKLCPKHKLECEHSKDKERLQPDPVGPSLTAVNIGVFI